MESSLKPHSTCLSVALGSSARSLLSVRCRMVLKVVHCSSASIELSSDSVMFYTHLGILFLSNLHDLTMSFVLSLHNNVWKSPFP